jgi:hypothetical protein
MGFAYEAVRNFSVPSETEARNPQGNRENNQGKMKMKEA